MYLKTFSPSGWDLGSEPTISVVKSGSRGLRGNDLAEFIKKAGDEAACRFAQIEPKPGEHYLHILAMGCTEVISPNRNGDGWKQAILIESHPTFVKYGHWHRNHKIGENDGIYGKVRASWYNHKMGRVELIAGLFETQKAASAYHQKRGRVADKELTILGRGQELPTSMSGLVPHDFCSGCRHKAKGRDNYCREDICKYGGLYHNIGRVFEDGHHLHADNPSTKFIDISGIFNEDTLQPDLQADRIAYVLGQLKTASAVILDRQTPPMVALEMFEGSYWGMKQAKALQEMIEYEKEPGLSYRGSALPANHPVGLKNPETHAMLNSLAKKGICLSLRDFAAVLDLPAEAADSAALYAKTALRKLSKHYTLDELLNNNPFRFENCGAEMSREALFSIAPEAVRKRAWLDVGLENEPQNQAVESDGGEALADLHALYRLGFGASLEKSPKLGLHLSTLARQNLSQ